MSDGGAEPSSRRDGAERALAAARLAARAMGAPYAAALCSGHGAAWWSAGPVPGDVRAALVRLCERVAASSCPSFVGEGADRPVEAFAGVPLDGGGAVAVADGRAREWTGDDRAALAEAAALAPSASAGAEVLLPAGPNGRRDPGIFRAMFSGSFAGLAVVDLGGRIVRANVALGRMLGVRPSRLFGRRLARFVAGDDPAAASVREALARGGEARGAEVRLVGRGGREAWVRVRITVRRRAGTPVFSLAMVEDVTPNHRAAEALHRGAQALELMRRVAAAANRATSVGDLLRDALELTCRYVRWPAGHVWLREPGGVLVSSGIWRKHQRGTFPTLEREIGGLRLRDGEGIAGRAAVADEPLWIEDVEDETHPATAAVAHAGGVRAVIAWPIRAEGTVVGVVEMFCDHPEPRDPELLELLAGLGSQLGVAVERERVAARLRESRRELATLLTNLPGMAYRCRMDERWTMEFVSEGAAELTGYGPGELVGNAAVSFSELIVPADRERVWAEVRAAREAGSRFDLRYRITARDGRERWLREHGAFVDRDGRETVLEGFITDVTQQRLAEEALRRSGEYFRALIESSTEVVAVGNADGRLRYVSPSVERMTGFTPREWTEMEVWGAAVPEDKPGMAALFHRLLEHPGETVETRFRMRTKHGEERVIEAWARNLLHDPAVMGIVHTSRDVTERTHADEELRRRERHFRSLIENAHDIITVLEGDGDVRFVSPSVERTLGYERSQLAGVYLFELVHPDDVPMVLEVFDRAIRSPGEPQALEFRIRHADGSWRTLEAFGTSLLHDPAVTGIVVNSRDVTERNRAQEALRVSQQQLLQAQKMDAVGRLAGGVAHDFNNLLTAIRGNAELLLLDTPPGDPRRDDVEEIRRAADRAAALTRQLLAFSRRQVLQPRVLDLNSVVQEVDRMLRRLISEDVELDTRLDRAVRQVRADPGQIEQVLLNLAVNARDAMPAGGRLTVETRNAVLGEELRGRHPYVVPGEYVLLAVTDTGTGMDPETRERAFEPFFTTKPAGRGTGLGLSTVYGIVKQSGGFIFIDSELGRGTSVRIYLPPAATAEAEAGASAAPGASERGTETILLAEDAESVRRLAVRVLSRAGYTVLEAGDGEEALRVAERHPGRIDVLLTDVVMPRMGGRELAVRIREARPGVRVIFVSGYNEDAVQLHGVLDPGAALVGKPFTSEQLLASIRRALDERASGA